MIERNGYIKVHRKMMNSDVFTDSNKMKLWMICLFNVAYEQTSQLINGEKVTLNAGEFVTGRYVLEEQFNKGVKKANRVSGITLMRMLKSFASSQMLNIKTTNKYTLVTVLNWSDYQDSEQQSDIKVTSNRHQPDTKKKYKKYKELNNKDIVRIFDHWNSKKIRVHRTMDDKLTKQIQILIDELGSEQIIMAIDTYDAIIKSKEYYFDYKWSLIDFLKRGISKFTDEEVAKSNYRSGTNGLDRKEKYAEDSTEGIGYT